MGRGKRKPEILTSNKTFSLFRKLSPQTWGLGMKSLPPSRRHFNPSCFLHPLAMTASVWINAFLKNRNSYICTWVFSQDIFKQATEDRLTSAKELPYFEGDFWPNVLEESIKELEQEEEERKREENTSNESTDVSALHFPFQLLPWFSWIIQKWAETLILVLKLLGVRKLFKLSEKY